MIAHKRITVNSNDNSKLLRELWISATLYSLFVELETGVRQFSKTNRCNGAFQISQEPDLLPVLGAKQPVRSNPGGAVCLLSIQVIFIKQFSRFSNRFTRTCTNRKNRTTRHILINLMAFSVSVA